MLYLFLLFTGLYFLILAVIIQIFNAISELGTPFKIPTKEAKSEMEKHPKVTVQYSSKLYKLFYASYS